MRSRPDVASALEGLAENADDGQGARLRSLASALRQPGSNSWCDVDVFHLVGDPLGVEEEVPESRTSTALDVLRNILLLLPVMITWGGISFAVSAYRDLISGPQRASADGVSFLQLWTTGFGGRTWVTLDVVAVLDAVAILSVIVIVFLSTALRRREAHQAGLLRGARRVELHDALADATLHLAEERRRDRDGGGAKALAAAHEEAARRLGEAHDGISRALAEGADQVQAMAAATAQVRSSGDSLVAGVGELRDQISDVRHEVGRLDTVVGSLVSGAEALTTRVPEVGEHLNEVVDSVQEVGRHLEDLGAGQGQVVERLAVLAEHPQEAARSAERAAETARSAQEALADAITALPQRLDDLRVEISQALERELDERGKAAAHLGRSSESALKAAGHAEEAVAGLVVGLGDMRRLGTDITEAAARGIQTRVDGLSTEIGRLETRLGELVAGTQGLGDEVPEFRRGLEEMAGRLKGVEINLGRITSTQEGVVEGLSAIADNPLAAAQAAKRTSETTLEAVDGLSRAVGALPQELQTFSTGVLAGVTRELDQRNGTREQLEASARSAVEAARASATASEQLAQGMARVQAIPQDVAIAMTGVAQNLQASRVLMSEIAEAAEARQRRRWFSR